MEKKIKNIRIIINPAAGSGESILPVINASMKEAGIKWEASITHEAGDAIQFAKAAVKEGIDALAVYGGDGTHYGSNQRHDWVGDSSGYFAGRVGECHGH